MVAILPAVLCFVKVIMSPDGAARTLSSDRHPEARAKRASKDERPRRWGCRPSRLVASRRAPQGDEQQPLPPPLGVVPFPASRGEDESAPCCVAINLTSHWLEAY